MKVYEGNWSAKTRDHLIRRIKIKQKEIDQDIVIKMFMANRSDLSVLTLCVVLEIK